MIAPFEQDTEQDMWLMEINRYATQEETGNHEGIIEVRASSKLEVEFLAKEIVAMLNTQEHAFRRALNVPKRTHES